jgi:superfamily I DNA/RNA helicase
LLSHASSNLSEKQLQIIQSIDFVAPGLDAVVAGAGAGKTRCLSYLVLKALIAHNVNNVYILTSTRVSKDEAYSRVASLYDELEMEQLGVRRLFPSFVKTIHAFGLRALRCVNEAADGGGAQVIHKAAICDLIKTHLDAVLEDKSFEISRDDVCAGLAPKDAVELLYNVRAERLKQLMPLDDNSLGEVSKEVLSRVRKEMLANEASGEQRLVDFDEIIRELADSDQPIIHDGDLLVVDEAQDLNRCQMQVVLNCLRAGNRNVLVLGDDSQGIFQFSGAVHNTIKTILSACEGDGIRFARHTLFQNHRSTNQIVRASEMLLPPSDAASRVGVRGNGDGVGVEVCVAPSPETEARRIAERAIKLVADGLCKPEDMVFLRHTNWSWTDPLLGAIKTEAKKNGILFPTCILGAPSNTTISMKALAILQVALGSERFVAQDDSAASDLLKIFAKSVRCTKGTPVLTTRVFAKVWEAFNHGDIATLFTKRQNELLECFRLLLKEEEDASPPSSKKQKTLTGAELTSVGAKEKNFVETVRVLGQACRVVKQRLGDAVHNRVPMGYAVLDTPAPIDGRPTQTQMKKAPPPSARPEGFQTNLGGVAWIVIRDLVDHAFEKSIGSDGKEPLKMTIEREEIHSLISALDVPLADATTFGDAAQAAPAASGIDRVAEAWEAPISKLLGALLDKETSDKAKFSTIHKYKGKESGVAFVTALKDPYVRIDASRRAALGPFHLPACANKNGRNNCACMHYKKKLDEIEEGMRAEKQRLHYVAASRARQRLFLSAADSNYPLAALTATGVGGGGQWERME